MQKPNFLKNIIPATLIVAGFVSSPVYSQSIKQLTSDKQSKKVENKVDEVARMTGTSTKYHSIGIGVGQTFLQSDFADTGEDKITAELFYEYAASHSFDFLANFHYSTHKYLAQKTTITGLALGIKAKMFNFDAFAPYATGGFGFYNPKQKREINGEIVESKSKLTFGYHFGAGAELDLNKNVKVGFLGALHNPFDVSQETQPEVEGSYYKLLLTVFYKFN